ncbi:hypothetical protein EDB84DRAFT_1518160 [Lactarius hengduanensis]|nr:hypothetical protein EDB84DRAFT_1518160 [Lactarius hengduanensis]
MIVVVSAFLRLRCAWSIISICRITLSLCPRWWVLSRGVVCASVDFNSTRSRGQWGGGDAESSFGSSVASCSGHSRNNLSSLGFREV